MVNKMNYYIQKPDELYHYGIKGMRWGHRKQRPIGNGIRRQSSWAQASQMARQANAQRRQSWKRSNVKNLSAHEQKVRRRTKVARAALIVAGSAAMAYSVYKINRTPALKQQYMRGVNAVKKFAGNARRNIYTAGEGAQTYKFGRRLGMSRSEAFQTGNLQRQALNRTYASNPRLYEQHRRIKETVRRQMRGL